MKKSTNGLGFTIIELIVVVTVVGILAAITVVSYSAAQGRARDTTRRADIANITKALEQYYDDNGSYPTTSGASSTIQSYWYLSTATGWTSTLATALNGIISPLPVDPRNNGSFVTARQFSYAYFSGTGCGKSPGQWYVLLYEFEASDKEKFTDGTATACVANDGDTFFNTYGASYYRVVR